MTPLVWHETCDFSGNVWTEVGDYKITESGLGHFYVELVGRHSRLPIAPARLAYSLERALSLAGE
jgi:hypothetical protein